MVDHETIIFDFDGTIADSLMLVISIFRELTGWRGARTPEDVARMRRLPIRKVVKEVKVPLYQVPPLLMRGRKMMAAQIAEVPLFDGMHEVIQKLHAQGHRMLVMSTNSTQNVESFLRLHHLEEYFDAVYGGVGLLNKAAALRRLIRQKQLDRKKCVYIGDEHRDIEGARKVHMKAIAVTWGYNDIELLRAHHPFAIAEKPTDLLEIFRS